MEDTKSLRRRGVIAGVAALAAGLLATKGAQPVAAQSIDTQFFGTATNDFAFLAEGGNRSEAAFATFNHTSYLYGVHAGGTSYGVWGETASGVGIYGNSTTGQGVSGTSSSSDGVIGTTDSTTGGAGVHGFNSSGNNAIGVKGETGAVGYGVVGGTKGGATTFNGGGVYGLSDNGYGVQGSSNNIGVRGDGTGDGSYGVAGYSNGTTGAAVYGENTSSYGTGVYGKVVAGNGVEGVGSYGVFGNSTVTTNGGIGVFGQVTSAVTGGYAVFGNNPGTNASNYGVAGSAKAGTGVYGTSSTGIGVYGVNTGGSGAPYGVVGSVTKPGIALYGVAGVAGAVGFAAGASVVGAIAGQFSGNVNFYGGSVGNTVTLNGANLVVANGGTKNAAVKVADGSFRLLHCVEAPEPWFEDFGEATLSGGKAEVKLEPVFASTIDTGTLHVFLTPHDESHHLAVKARNGGGFSVAAGVSGDAAARGLKAGDVSGTFTWRVVGKRKDVNGERLARFDIPKEITFAPPPPPTTPPEAPKLPTLSAPAIAQAALPSTPPTPPTPPMKKGA